MCMYCTKHTQQQYNSTRVVYVWVHLLAAPAHAEGARQADAVLLEGRRQS